MGTPHPYPHKTGGGGGGACEVLPLQNGGGAQKRFHSLKREVAQKVLPCLVSDLQFSHFVATLPVINDQSLKCFRYQGPTNLVSGLPGQPKNGSGQPDAEG